MKTRLTVILFALALAAWTVPAAVSAQSSQPAQSEGSGLNLRTRIGWGSIQWGYIDWSPDGQTLAVQTSRGIVLLKRDHYDAPRFLEGQVWSFNFSPNGQMLAVAYNSGIKLYDSTGTTLIRQLTNPSADAANPVDQGLHYFSFSPDSKLIAIMNGGGVGERPDGGSVWDVATGKKRYDLKGPSGQFLWLNGGRILMMAQGGWEGDPTFDLFDVATGKPLPVPDGYYATSADASPDGTVLAIAADQVTLWNTVTRQEILKLPLRRTSFLDGLEFSPDGKSLVVYDMEAPRTLWNIRTEKQIAQFDANASYFLFSPDNVTLAYEASPASAGAARSVHLWDIRSKQDLVVIPNAFHPFYSDDGKIFGYITGDGSSLVLQDAVTGKQIVSLDSFGDGASEIAWLPDSQRLLVTNQSQGVREWDITTGKVVRTEALADMPSPYAKHQFRTISGDHTVGALFDKNQVQLWDIASDTLKQTLDLNIHLKGNEFLATVLNLDGSMLAYRVSGSADHSIYLIYLPHLSVAPVPMNTLPNDVNSNPLAFSPDGKYLLSQGANSLRLWDVGSLSLLNTFDIGQYAIRTIAFSPDDRILFAGESSTDDNYSDSLPVFMVWNLASGTQIAMLPDPNGGVQTATFSPDSKSLALGHNDATLSVWNIKDREQVAAGSPTPIPQMVGMEQANAILQDRNADKLPAILLAIRALKAAYSPQADADLVRALGAAYGRPAFSGHTDAVTSVAFRPDGKYIVTGSQDRTALVWEVSSGQSLLGFSGHYLGVNIIAFSPDGKYVLTGGGDGYARLWDSRPGHYQSLHSYGGFVGRVTSVAFSPDGQFLLTGSYDGMARLWDVNSIDAVNSANNANGATVPNSIQDLRTFSGHTGAVMSVAFSPDGKEVLTGSADGTARLWDASSGQSLRTFSGHTDWVHSVAFSPDGKYLLTGSSDRTARLWDASTGQAIRTFTGHSGAVNSVAFSPDGQYVLTGSDDQTARLWDVDYRSVIAHACNQVWRDFTPGERQQFGIHDNEPTCSQFANGETSLTTPLPPTWTPLAVTLPALTPIPSITPSPTLTPSATRVPAQTLSASSLIVQRPAPGYDASQYLFITAGLKLADPKTPTVSHYAVTVKANETRTIRDGWCADNQTILDDNLKHITFQFLLNKQPIPESNLLELNQPGCLELETIVSGWEAGKTYTLDMETTLDTAVNDGTSTYAPGTYGYNLTISVTP
ncbi:MAG TPA: WD40 repeat domain-containing protein [Aggregatilineales bacterium]|nr:WD40 repeat domain-containing protein [Aggregatilineales bacterium]